MSFLYPAFLFALGALTIPIIIHLFYFRRFKKVYFTNVRFLKELKEETSSRSRIKQWLVLAMRLLSLLFLIFAFAQPFLPQGAAVKKSNAAVSIFIDNSFSMSALSEDVKLLEKAKQRSREIVQAYSENDKFQILTNDFEGRHQRLVSKQDALNYIDEVQPSPTVKELSKVLTRQKQALFSGKMEQKESYILSDFQKNITDIQTYKDTTVAVHLIPLQAVQEKNVSIDSCWFDTPVQLLNQVNRLTVKVKNYSNQPADNVRLTLKYDGQEKPVGTMSIPANSSVTDTVMMSILRPGWQEAELAITDYPIQFDDRYFFSFNVEQQINVLIINELNSNKYLDASFAATKLLKATNAQSRSLDYSKLANYNLIILNEVNTISSGLASELSQYINNGGNVLLFPAAAGDEATYRNLMQNIQAGSISTFESVAREVASINTEGYVFKNVFDGKTTNLRLPKTKGNFKLLSSSEALMTYRDGNVFLSRTAYGAGNFYVSAAPLNDTYNDLAKNGEIFLPMLFKMAIASGKEPTIAYTIGVDESIETENIARLKESVYKMQGKKEEFIPQQQSVGSKLLLHPYKQITDAGFYRLFLNQDSTLARFAYNYDRKESNLAYFTPTELESITSGRMKVIAANAQANFTAMIGEQNQGIVLWRYCIMAVLLFLLAEVAILRFWK